MTDHEFWNEIRRHLIGIARAIKKRYNQNGLLFLLGVKPDK